MIAIEILVNGVRHVLAGSEDWELLHANIVAQRAGSAGLDRDEFSIKISGMPLQTQPGTLEHMRWGSRQLELGDELTVRLVSVDSSDPPLKRYRSDNTVQECPFTDAEIEELERQDYARLKAKFEPGHG